MASNIPEKAKLLKRLKEGGFDVPDFIFLLAEKFKSENFTELFDTLYMMNS